MFIITNPYNPADWYWLGKPDRFSTDIIYSSKKGSIVSASDPDYIAFLGRAGSPQAWPKDRSGHVTVEALDEVLEKAGQPKTGLALPSVQELNGIASTFASELLSAMRPYTIGDATIKSDATSGTIAQLSFLAKWGEENAGAPDNWVANDHSVTVVTGYQYTVLFKLVSEFAQAVYGTKLAEVLRNIASGTITTEKQIRDFDWGA